MADKLLEVKGVSKIFRVGGMLRGKKLVAVDNVSLSIDDDKPVILSIVGESGCGKSTLCKMILRLHNPDMGDIVMDGKSYADKKSYDPKQYKLDVQPLNSIYHCVIAIAFNLSASRDFTKSFLIGSGIITAIKNCRCFVFTSIGLVKLLGRTCSHHFLRNGLVLILLGIGRRYR